MYHRLNPQKKRAILDNNLLQVKIITKVRQKWIIHGISDSTSMILAVLNENAANKRIS